MGTKIQHIFPKAILTLALVSQAFATGIVIDFTDTGINPGYGPDALAPYVGLNPKGTLLTSAYSALGLQLSSVNGYAFDTNKGFVGTFPGAPQTGNFAAFGSMVPTANLTATFAGLANCNYTCGNQWLASGVSLTLGTTTGPGGVTIQTYDLNGQLLETVPVNASIATVTFTQGQIHSFRLIDNGGSGFFLSRLHISPYVEPEPGTILLMATGLGLISLVARRKRRNRLSHS